MAGPFYNPQAGMGIEAAGASAVVSPVAPVRTSGADAVTAGLNLATQGVSLYAQAQRYKGRYGGTRSGRPDPNLARFSEEVQIALRNKEQFGEGRFKMDMNRIVQNFGSAGQAIDKDMLNYFEQTTGLPSDTYFGIDPVEKFKATQIQTPEIQAAAAPLIAAGMDQEKALNQALEEQQTFTRLAQKLSQADTQNAVEYMASNGGQETQQGIIQFFRDTAYSRLNALVNTGKATEQDARIVLSNYQALLATPKMQIPSGVSAEVRAQEIASRNNLKGSIETVVKLLDAGEQGQSLLQQIAQNPKMSDDDKKNMLARIALLSAKDPAQLMSFMGIEDMNALIKGNTSLGKLPPSNFELGNLNNVTAKGLATAPPGQAPPPEEIVPPELSDAIKKMSSSELVSFTQGSAKKASFPGWDFNSQEDVKAFATSIYSVAQGLTAPQQNRLRTIDDLGKLLNRNIFKNLDSLDKVDPEQAALLRASLGVGLTTELTRRKVQLSSIEKSLVGDATSDGITTAKFNPETGKYELTPEFIDSQTPEDMKSFQVGVEYAYGGDLAKGAENNFVRLTTARSPNQGPGDASKVVSDGNLIRIEDAQRNRRATAALRQFYSSLDAGGQLPPLAQEFSDPSAEARRVAATVAGTAPMDKGQTMDQAPPPPAVEQPADQGTDEEGGRSILQRGLDLIFSPAAAAELTPELRAQLEAVGKRLPAKAAPLPDSMLPPGFRSTDGVDGIGSSAPVFVQAINKVESGTGGYNTLYANADSTEFSDVKVSEMTLDELVTFSRPSNDYGRWVKPRLPEDSEARKKGYTSTPMGKYQIVGTTLKTTMKQMGLDGSEVFTPELQDRMAIHIGKKALKDKTGKAAISALRSTWEGFKKIADEDLLKIAEELRNSESSGTGLASQGRPFPRPEVGAEVTESSMLGSLVSSLRSALNLGSNEEAQSVAEKLMQSGIIPRRPEGLSVDEPMRLPPVRPTEQEMAEANQLTPSEQRIADARERVEARRVFNVALNKAASEENTPNFVESTITGLSEATGLGVMGEAFINDIVSKQLPSLNSWRKTTLTEESLDPDELSVMQKLYEKVGLGKVNYADYGADASIGLGKNRNKSNLFEIMGYGAEDRTQKTFGEGTFVKEGKDIFFVDQYDWNFYTVFNEGKKSELISPEEYEKSGRSVREDLLTNFKAYSKDQITMFQLMHNVGFLLGSRDYKGTQKDSSKKIKIKVN